MNPILLALLSAVLFGAATPAEKVLLDRGLSPLHLAGIIYLCAGIAALPFARRGREGAPPLSAKDRLRLALAVALGGGLGPAFLLLGTREAGQAADVALWKNFEPAWTAVIGCALFKDHLGRRGWIGVAGMVLAGVSLALPLERGAAGTRAGGLIALGCVCWGFDNHLTALVGGISAARITMWKGLVAGPCNLLLGFAAGGELPAAPLPWIGAAAAVGVLCYGASIAVYITAARALGATRAMMAFATAPFFGLLFSPVLREESLLPAHGGVAALMGLSLVVLFLDRHAHDHRHEKTAHDHYHRHDDGHHDHLHEGEPASLYHSHYHEHGEKVHTHPHWPDLHHRHGH